MLKNTLDLNELSLPRVLRTVASRATAGKALKGLATRLLTSTGKALAVASLLFSLGIGFPAAAFAANNYDCGAYGSSTYGSQCDTSAGSTTNRK